MPSAYYEKLPDHMRHQVTWVDTSPLAAAGFEQASEGGEQRWNDAEARIVMSLLRQVASKRDDLHGGGQARPAARRAGHRGHLHVQPSKRRSESNEVRGGAGLGDARRLVKIDTVDSYQGKENRIIILSTVRNNAGLQRGFPARAQPDQRGAAPARRTACSSSVRAACGRAGMRSCRLALSMPRRRP